MLILASKSPRRKELLEQASLNFIIKTKEVDEIFNKNLSIEEALIDVAYQKVMPVFYDNMEDTIIGADTIVVCDNQILGKPKNYDDASYMLNLLSNKVHYVMTAVIIKNNKKEIKFIEKTKVYFKQLTQDEIDYYIEHDNVYDKAGSYAIQGIGAKFIKCYEGEFDNIVGLPMRLVFRMLNM